ncbi:MAG: electron transfer flavoprotein beta subunit/FixA family protein [Propionibacterium sp.]|nr:electron transfer flavoprotein beta subunit/FixA family protein [Propionibacterium sp.]MDN6565646.1 electron transfer flavoprotein beta subunit/FixA family protein [Actinomyces sp.]MDN6793636.1 electron transfer flavoprotein beta subunit/FixA family protein [Propionibacterium sp.]
MKIVVAYKWAASPQDASVGADGSVDWSRAKASFGEYDAVAAELGRRLADESGAEVVGVSVGGPAVVSSLAKKGALSRGLDRAVLVGDAPEDARGPLATGRALAALVSRIGDVDVVLAGDASVDVAAGVVPSVLAGELGWPVVTQVTSVTPQDGALRVTRSLPSGSETLLVPAPAVLCAAADAVVARVPGMKDILQAGKKPSENVAYADLGLEAAPSPAQASASPVHTAARRGVVIDGSDPASAATELVGALRSAGTL